MTPGFDPATGSLAADDGTVLGPGLSLAAFLDSPLADGASSIGEGREYSWGFVSSVFDEKSGGSEIVIRHGAALPDRLPPSPIRFVEGG